MEQAFAPLLEEIQQKHNVMDRVIVFGQSYGDCTHIYQFISCRLGKEMSHPVEIPQLAEYRMVDLFTACMHPTVKNTILTQFQDSTSCLHVVIATVSFGMGLDCPNVRRIIHWGVPSDIEACLQETSRAGRDEQAATAVLSYEGSDFSGVRVEQKMKDYCALKQGCRRDTLLRI